MSAAISRTGPYETRLSAIVTRSIVMRNGPQRMFPRVYIVKNHMKLDFWVFVFLDSPNIQVYPSSFTFLKKGKES